MTGHLGRPFPWAATAPPRADLEHFLDSFIFCARAEGKSPRTVDKAITSVLSLLDFLRASGLSAAVDDIGPGELRRYIVHLQGVRAYQNHPYNPPRDRGLSGHTVNGYLRALRAFWSWLVREEVVPTTPFARVKIPRAPHKVVPTFGETQLQALFAAVPRTTASGFRDWAMLITMLDTGMRASELVNLTIEDVDLGDGTARVTGKGNKERVVPIGATAQRALWRYVERYRPRPARPLCTHLFLTREGGPMTVNRLEKRLRDYGAVAGLEGVRCSPHTLRHTFAISYLRNGGDVFSLQRILGHSTLDIVRIYVNMSDVDVKACHRRCSPADNLDLTSSRALKRTARGGMGKPERGGAGSLDRLRVDDAVSARSAWRRGDAWLTRQEDGTGYSTRGGGWTA